MGGARVVAPTSARPKFVGVRRATASQRASRAPVDAGPFASPRERAGTDQTVRQFIKSELVPPVRAALREPEVRAAVQTLTEPAETLTTELVINPGNVARTSDVLTEQPEQPDSV